MLTVAPKPIERRFRRRRLLTTALAETDALHQFAQAPDRFIELYGGDIIKQDRTSTVLSTSFDGQTVVIKRFNRRNIFHPIKRALRRSRAEHCFHNALLLANQRIPTPPPLAAVEERFGPLRGNCWFIAKQIDGNDLLQWFQDVPTPTRDHPIVQQIHRFFLFLSQNRIAHGDLKATNLFVSHDRLFVLDLDGMRRYRTDPVHRDRLARDARRFLKNWREQPEVMKLFAAELQALIDAEPPQSRWIRQRLR